MLPIINKTLSAKTIFFLIILYSSYLFSQQNNSFLLKTDYLKINFIPSEGSFTFYTLNKKGETIFETYALGLFLNKRFQNDFKKNSDDQFYNESLNLSFKIVDDNTIAVEWSVKDSALHEFQFHLRSDDETEYYGMGERFNSVNQRGYILPNITDDRYGNKGVGTHKPIPFFMSNRGLGVWVDSYSPGVFDLNGSERFETRISFKENKLRIVFIGGENYKKVLSAYTKLTGRPSLPPPWAFGLWKSRDVHHNQDSVFVDIENLRKYKIPASVLVIDSPWETGYNNFKVNTQQFTEPGRMFKRIEELGFNLCLWLTPFINKENVIDMKGIENESDNFSDAAKKGYLVKDKDGNVMLSEWWKGKGGLVDFTNPDAVEWWNNELKKMLNYNVKAFKCDDGEGNFVPDAVFHDGSSAHKMKNRYSLLYDSVMQNFINKYLNGEGVLINRSGYTGFQKYPFAWAGDNDADFSYMNGLPSVIIAGQNAALSGISLWGTDIAGYAGTPSKELFIRWTQFAVFCPFMQIHMTSNLGPWDFGSVALKIFRKFAVMRIQLFPYLYNAVYESVDEGIPVIRPMAYSFPDDPEASKNIYQFMFGPDILVAPIFQQGNHRTVYLPEGNWIDYWNGKTMSGKQYFEVEAALDKIPLYVKEGSIIPLLPEDVQTLVENPNIDDSIKTFDNRRILQVWPGADAKLETWDGISAKLIKDNNSYQLSFFSETKRPLTIEIINKRVSDLEILNAHITFNKEENKTIICYSSFSGEQVIKWEE